MSMSRWLIIATLFATIIFAPAIVMWANMPTLPEILPPITPNAPIGIALAKGRQARVAQDYPRAIEVYTEFLDSQTKPNWYTSVALRERAETYEALRQYDRAEADFTAALKASSISTSLYADRGAFYARRKRYDDALADFSKGAKLDPRSGKFAYQEARMLEERGNYQRAINRLDDAIRIEPKVRDYYIERGSAHNYAAMYAEARTDYDKALELTNPNLIASEAVRANFGRGYALLRLGLFQLAIDDFDRVINAMPTAANALAWRGEAYKGLGDIEHAIEDFKAALVHDQNQSNAQRGLRELQPSR